MQYLTENKTIFNDKHDAIEYETYFIKYTDTLLAFIMAQKDIKFSERDHTQFSRLLFNLVEDKDFDWNQ